MKEFLSGRLFYIFLLITVPTAVYFINVEVQSYLGRNALADTGLVSTNLSEAVSRAEAEGKLVLVDVSAIWCSNCRRLDREVFSDEGVKSVIAKDFVFTRLEYESDEGQKFLGERDVSGFPTLWLLAGDGKTVKRLRVTYDPNEFAAELRASRGRDQ
jgi:thiol:disulfide interchange protein